jgi:hypothetical protein
MWKSAGRAPSLRVFTLAFALQLRKKHGKTTADAQLFLWPQRLAHREHNQPTIVATKV